MSICLPETVSYTHLDVYKRQEQGGVSVDGNAVNDVKAVFAKESLEGEGVVVKRGKKKFVKVIAK